MSNPLSMQYIEDTALNSLSPRNSVLFLEIVNENARKILAACPEGLLVDDFLNVYSLNCKEPLYFADLGFKSIDDLLHSLESSVPLYFAYVNGEKKVFLKEAEEEDIPPDAAPIDAHYLNQNLPVDLDKNIFIPVYMSSVISPSNFYIQLDGEETASALKTLYDELEIFYKSECSASYKMRKYHIKVNTICAAKWPKDNYWYRVKVLSIPSETTVRVFYVDYGTCDTIQKDLLYYLKNDFLKLPAQALKAKLACLKPPRKDGVWPKEAQSLMLEMCQDVMLMANVVDTDPFGVHSIILCDTNGEKDKFVNDILLKKKLAVLMNESFDESPSTPNLEIPNTVYNQELLYKIQQLPFNDSVPSHYTSKTAIPPPPDTFSSQFNNVTSQANLLPLSNACNILGMNVPQTTSANCDSLRAYDHYDSSLVANIPPPSESVQSDECSSEDEVFESDDDTVFEEFLQKISKKRYVKRIITSDRYVFHLIVYKSALCVSVAEVSALIWPTKENFLMTRLQQKEEDLLVFCILPCENKEMFQQLLKCNVKGVSADESSPISLLFLKHVIAVLNKFGQPSLPLREKIIQEYASLNLNDPYWEAFSMEPENVEVFCGETDDDKLNRMCLYDLRAMKDSIKMQIAALEICDIDTDMKSTKKKKLLEFYTKVDNRLKDVKKIS